MTNQPQLNWIGFRSSAVYKEFLSVPRTGLRTEGVLLLMVHFNLCNLRLLWRHNICGEEGGRGEEGGKGRREGERRRVGGNGRGKVTRNTLASNSFFSKHCMYVDYSGGFGMWNTKINLITKIFCKMANYWHHAYQIITENRANKHTKKISAPEISLH